MRLAGRIKVATMSKITMLFIDRQHTPHMVLTRISSSMLWNVELIHLRR